ncbi:PE-PPE domain-containing protein [Mycolicibacterium sp. 018/SC-01/001]|uniref:PE-PPE domain-containing protein n=1 Tax=Mycolicibacterium sp. 018/SC-01/001 TaxID=2592069 RepID=UPI00117BFDAA|nr:PE-PPE domain-containing protein [Mycolicibacterium sp. 018/SC-01/001]TRW82383.1 PE-PPE domain-containing protein [Mycolicibacterium sp. 018/SC-01/001]
MKSTIRKAGVACGTAFASIALALSTATGAGAVSTAVIIGGIKIKSMDDTLMKPLLEGAFKDDVRTSVTWPAEAGPYSGKGDMTLGASIRIGIPNLDAAIDTAVGNLSAPTDKVTVVGLSAGSLVVNEVMRQWMEEGTMPDPSKVTFIVVEDSSRQELIKDAKYSSKYDYTYQPPPVTPFNVVVITGEYDGMADMPDRPWNFLAMANAMAGAIVVHVPVMYTTSMAELESLKGTMYYEKTVNAKGGVTEHYLVPTATLPLVQLMPWLKPKEAELTAKIQKGYSRYDNVTTPVAKVAALAAPVTAEAADSTAVKDSGTGDEASAGQAQPEPKTAAQARRDARAEARAEAKAQRAEAKAARAEARATAKAEAAAKREARKAARQQAAKGDSSSNGSGSSDSSGSSE